MQEISYANDMLHICRKYAKGFCRNMQLICIKNVINMQKYAFMHLYIHTYMPHICRHMQYIHICINMQNICNCK